MSSRKKIMEAASRLLHKKGFQATTVDEIAEAAGVTKSNLYYHFGSKEEMALEVIERMMEEFELNVIQPTLMEDSLPPIERLTIFYDKITATNQDLGCRGGCPFGNLALELGDVNEDFRKSLSNFFNKWLKAIEHCIGEGVESGEFRSDIHPELAAVLILTQLEGSILMIKTHKTIEPLIIGTQTVIKLLSVS